jgi:hydroxymethylpyrimidine/phosphomethylpyrimidine kinase
MENGNRIPRVLTIAGSDSGGGAGVQADLKAIAACGGHGMTAVTAVTAQNTLGVSAIHHVPPDVIVAQVRAVVEDIGVDAVKIGMLGNTGTIDAVLTALDFLPASVPVVIDPVMVAESGADLLEPAARIALVELLLPRATVVTPNVPEATAIVAGAGEAPGSGGADFGELALAVHALGPAHVVLTGGHRSVATDIYTDGLEVIEIPGPRYADGAAHGSGCTHSSALATWLARGEDPLTAARHAREVAATAIAHGLRELGGGAGPVDALNVAALAPLTSPDRIS